MRRRTLAGTSAAGLFLAAVGVLIQSAPPPATTSPAIQSRGLDPEQLDFARRPISYFNARCGSCHGNYGSFWGEGFAAALDEQGLREVVDEMAAGPAQAPLEGLALEVQVAYHRSLVDQKPFVTAYVENGKLAGEAAPGSTVSLMVDGQERPATLTKHSWSGDVQRASAVRVTKGEQRTD